jgi:predicted branched-subunit amino acid permease
MAAANRPSDAVRSRIVRDGVAVGIATGAYGVSFGALSSVAGLSLAQTCTLSLLMFTGASQFALVGVVNSGGNPLAGAATAVMLGVRNTFYGLRLSSLLRLGGARRFLAAHLVIDESTAMAIARGDTERARIAFWATGVAIFVCWNVGTVLGALGAEAFSDPSVLGLDAAAPAAFLALLASRLRGREPWTVALVGAGVAIIVTPFVPATVPVLAAAAVAVGFGIAKDPGSTA